MSQWAPVLYSLISYIWYICDLARLKGKIKLVQTKKPLVHGGIVPEAVHGLKAVWVQHAIYKVQPF